MHAKTLKHHIILMPGRNPVWQKPLAQSGRQFRKIKPAGRDNYGRRDRNSSTPVL
jgi:hypothetical protein